MVVVVGGGESSSRKCVVDGKCGVEMSGIMGVRVEWVSVGCWSR